MAVVDKFYSRPCLLWRRQVMHLLKSVAFYTSQFYKYIKLGNAAALYVLPSTSYISHVFTSPGGNKVIIIQSPHS